jgi:hypothetical protein
VGSAAFCALRDKAPSAPFSLLEHTMTTPRPRSLVSLAAALTIALILGGCASAGSHPTSDGSTPADGPPPVVIHFDNQAHDYVHVYLVGARSQWLLGRVEPGAIRTLRIPDEALEESSRAVWLAVLMGQHPTGRVAGNPSAVTTIPELVSTILSQRWTFTPTPASGQLTSLPLWRTDVGHP